MIHRIDKEILKKLLTHDGQRFSELKPVGIESNAFTYRLKKLMKEGVVGKSKDGVYHLTSQGRFYTDRLNLGKFTERTMPKSLLLLVCRNEKGEWLLLDRHIHPLKDLIGLPHGHVKIGMSVTQAAEKRLREVMGLTTSFAYRGSGYLTVYKNGELEGYNHFDILENIAPIKGTLNTGNEHMFGDLFWQKDPDFSDARYIPSLRRFKELLDAGVFPFFEEITLEL